MLSTNLRSEKVRINTYGSPLDFLAQEPKIMTVQCAKVTNLDNEVNHHRQLKKKYRINKFPFFIRFVEA